MSEKNLVGSLVVGPVRRPLFRHQLLRLRCYQDRSGEPQHHQGLRCLPRHQGCVNDQLMIMDEEDPAELANMMHTPSSALLLSRYKIVDPDVDDIRYKRILEIFKKYNVRYFFYNGGNDSMDTCNKDLQVHGQGRQVPGHGVPDHRQRSGKHRPLPRLRLLPSTSPPPSWKSPATARSTTPAWSPSSSAWARHVGWLTDRRNRWQTPGRRPRPGSTSPRSTLTWTSSLPM